MQFIAFVVVTLTMPVLVFLAAVLLDHLIHGPNRRSS